MSSLSKARSGVGCSLLLLLLTQTQLLSVATPDEGPAATCPFTYEEHSLGDIRSGAKRPYLFGGIYNQTKRDCINCQRGGLWANFCSFSSKGNAVPFWDNQLCSSQTVDAVIGRVLKQNNHDLLSMTPCELWPYLRGRTTWVIGDSMSKDLFKAIKCFMLEFQDLATYHASSNYTAMHLLDSIPKFGEPRCVHMPQRTRLCQIHAIQGDLFIEGNRTKIGVLPLLQQSMAHFHDIFIVNFGLWHGETKQPEYKQNLHQLGKFYTDTKAKFPNLFWMETPKQHFDSVDGDYKVPWIGKRKGPFTCQPVQGLSMDADGALHADAGNAVAEFVMQGSWRNIMARDILAKKYKLPFIPVYNSSATAWQFHRVNFDGQECSHYCHPSIPQLWVWVLKQTLQRHGMRPVGNWQEVKRRKPGCATVLDRDEGQYGGAKSVDLVLKQQQQFLQKQQEQRLARLRAQQQPQGFLSWLLGLGRRAVPDLQLVPLRTVQLMDGVAVFPADTATDGASSSSSNGPGKTLNPWQMLDKALDGQQRHHHHRRQRQAKSNGNR
ncbi:hypothetical protein COO60DRAFT_619659 [Scenedesmus sp. NREL 46B-D3]|nr:hypothetical protein COO60DRAFT_619659 [Scenedesmus sp. NREL 46B-D3]